MKKIMLQGYLQEPNFGDVLYGRLFYNKCKELGFDEIDFFQYKNLGIGPHCRNEYGYHTKKNIFSCLRADALVIMSGGYLWDNGLFWPNRRDRFRRYILPARLYQMLGKPVYVLGAGGGEVKTPWLRKSMVKVLNKAKVVTFRDKATKKIFEEYGVKNKTSVTADTALAITQDMLPPLREKDAIDKFANGKKKILFHLPDGIKENEKFAQLIVPILIKFLSEHKDYAVVISHDNIRPLPPKEIDAINSAKKQLSEADIEYFDYNYHDSLQMCSLIHECDCIISGKLHVCVMGSLFGKCVVSFPVNNGKTQNYFDMLDEPERCLHIDSVEIESGYKHICDFCEKPTHVDDALIQRASENLELLSLIANE